MIENTNCSCEEDPGSEVFSQVQNGFTTFYVGRYGGDASGEIKIKLKNELCVEAMKQFIDHKKNH